MAWAGAVLSLCVWGPWRLSAQDNADSGYRALPRLHLVAELRNRSEAASSVDFEADHRHFDALSRLRLSAEVEARDWLSFDVELQDARTLAGRDADLIETNDNAADIRYAYVDVGKRHGHGLMLRLGRQPLSFGDERLIGADDPWSNRGRRFDGARAIWNGDQWHGELFSATLTPALVHRLDPVRTGERASGGALSWSSARHHATLESYVFWMRQHQPLPGADTPGQWNIWTPGVRLAFDLPLSFSFAGETALQAGAAVGEPIRAWAGTARLARRLGQSDTAPQVNAAYSYASGDRNPGDHRQGTFDDLYPAGYDDCGMTDPMVWRNIRNVSLGAQWEPRPKWHLVSQVRNYWLATVRDGFYVDEGSYFRYAPQASSSHVGTVFSAGARYEPSPYWDLAAGYGRFFAGSYMRQSGDGVPANSGFVSWTFHI
jgi:hypothetical protein